MAESSVVDYVVADSVATITLDRPESLNAMNQALMRGISTAMARVREDEGVRAVVLTGSGRGFCAGADLRGVAADDGPAEGSGDSDGAFTAAMMDFYNAPVPTIAKVNGAAAGGGFGLALAADITIACDSAFFVATFGPRLGIVPDMGATWSIPHSVGRARAMGISLLGDRITAREAEEMGLIWQCVADDELDAVVAATAARLARSAPSAMTRIRQSIDASPHHSFSEQMDLEMRHQAVLIPRNMVDGAKAFVAKTEPSFSGERY